LDSNYPKQLLEKHLNRIWSRKLQLYAHKKVLTHFIEISSIGNVIHSHRASTEAQERIGEHFLVRNVIQETIA